MRLELFTPPPSGSPYAVGGTEKTQINGSPLSRGNLKEGVQQDRLYEACQQFEAVFLLQLWRAMQRTIPQRRQTLNYAEMFDLTFAEYLARYGQFGIAERLYEQLSRLNQARVKNDAGP
ncbi:MAG: hypothetical protein ABDI19_02525 [Armatimonadota bacterium]